MILKRNSRVRENHGGVKRASGFLRLDGPIVYPLREPVNLKRPKQDWIPVKKRAKKAKRSLSLMDVKVQDNGRVHITFRRLDNKAWAKYNLNDKEKHYSIEKELRRRDKRRISEQRLRMMVKNRIPLKNETVVYEDVYHAIRAMDHIAESKHAEIRRLSPLIREVRRINLLLAERKVMLPNDKDAVLKPLRVLREELVSMTLRGVKDAYKDLALAALDEAIESVEKGMETVACTKMVKEFNRMMARFLFVVKRIYQKARRRKVLLEAVAEWEETRIEKLIENAYYLKERLESLVWANRRAKEILSFFVQPLKDLERMLRRGELKTAVEHRLKVFPDANHPLSYFEPYTNIIGFYMHKAFSVISRTAEERYDSGAKALGKEAASYVAEAARFIETLENFLTREEAGSLLGVIDRMDRIVKDAGQKYENTVLIKKMMPNIRRLIIDGNLSSALKQVNLLITRAEKEMDLLLKRKLGL